MSAKPEPRKPIKVAVIHPECGVSWNGGSQISAYEMAEHLAAHYEVELLCGEEVGTVSVVLPCVPRGRSANWLATTYIGGLFPQSIWLPWHGNRSGNQLLPLSISFTEIEA